MAPDQTDNPRVAATEAGYIAAAQISAPGGLPMHDATPAAWGALGRRGDATAMQKARQMSGGHPAPLLDRYGSANWMQIQALNNAVIYHDYVIAREYLSDQRKWGIGEGGPLYFPAGNIGYAIPILLCALADGVEDVAQGYAGFLAWASQLMEKLAWRRSGAGYMGIGPGPTEYPSERNNWLGEEGYVCMPGSRAAFSGHLRPNWYAEGPATNVYQWLTGTPGRMLSGRYADYTPTGDATWDSWPWIVATLRHLIPAKREAQPTLLGQAFREHDLRILLHGVELGPYKLRFGLDVVRGEHWLLVAASHPTASPKPPASWIEWADAQFRLAFPDGYRNQGNTGRGTIEWTGSEVWAEGVAVHGGNTVRLISKRHDRAQVREHWTLAPMALAWTKGALHPGTPAPVPPPGSEPPGEDEDRESWLERHKAQVIFGALVLAALIGALRGC